jgi:subtilisin family serine protease
VFNETLELQGCIHHNVDQCMPCSQAQGPCAPALKPPAQLAPSYFFVHGMQSTAVYLCGATGYKHVADCSDACDFVPAGLPGVMTVAAADVTHDATTAFPWSWSNYGQCVDIWAPGVEIESASPDCFECTAVYSGTSQATPLVSGLIAAHLAANPTDDAEDVKKKLQAAAAVNLLEVMGHPYDTTVNFFAQVCGSDTTVT